jgi:hypothetical protein
MLFIPYSIAVRMPLIVRRKLSRGEFIFFQFYSAAPTGGIMTEIKLSNLFTALLAVMVVWLLIERRAAVSDNTGVTDSSPVSTKSIPVPELQPLPKDTTQPAETREALRYVVFSLYGNESLFTIGAVRNAQLAKQVRPCFS